VACTTTEFPSLSDKSEPSTMEQPWSASHSSADHRAGDCPGGASPGSEGKPPNPRTTRRRGPCLRRQRL